MPSRFRHRNSLIPILDNTSKKFISRNHKEYPDDEYDPLKLLSTLVWSARDLEAVVD